jgi:hypothetical protein
LIISVSRRTDIPAFYTPWFVARIRAGDCAVPNPFNRDQISRVSLRPADVDAIVFWTRNPRPLFPFLRELDARGYHYYFQFTLLDYPRALETRAPPADEAVRAFQELARWIGADRVIWRYDPILLTEQTNFPYHLEAYTRLAQALKGHTTRSVVSIADDYAAARKRLQALEEQGVSLLDTQIFQSAEFGEFMRALARTAAQNGMEIVSCAEPLDLKPYGIKPGKCVDDDYIAKTFGIDVTHTKDPSQRTACGCVVSKDIGMYDSCLFGCQYCYATSSFERAKKNHALHDPNSPSQIGWYDVDLRS